MLQPRLLNITRKIAIALSDNGIFIDDKLLFTRPAFHSPPFQLLIDCELALTGGALDAETHQTGIYRAT